MLVLECMNCVRRVVVLCETEVFGMDTRSVSPLCKDRCAAIYMIALVLHGSHRIS